MTDQDQPDAPLSFVHVLRVFLEMAAYNLGDMMDPSTGKRSEVNLPAAREAIDLVAILQDKTKGNLDPQETELLEQLLYQLRMRYVEAEKGEPRIIQP